MDAAERGADIRTPYRVRGRRADRGRLVRHDPRCGGRAGGARAGDRQRGRAVGRPVLGLVPQACAERPPRLVKGAISSRALRAMLSSSEHGRNIVFIPYEDFTLIGTTDVPIAGRPGVPDHLLGETAYLAMSVNRYFAAAV